MAVSQLRVSQYATLRELILTLTMIVCTGCYTSFSRIGYAHHISKTTNIACSLRSTFDDDSSDSDTGESEDDSDDEDPLLPSQFTGDFFGSYSEDDLLPGGMCIDERATEEPEGSIEDDDSEDEGEVSDNGSVVEDASDEAVRPHWEAERPMTVTISGKPTKSSTAAPDSS